MLEDVRITVRQHRQRPGHIAAALVAWATGFGRLHRRVLRSEQPARRRGGGTTHRQDLVQVRWGQRQLADEAR
jgi:hypothetical protein